MVHNNKVWNLLEMKIIKIIQHLQIILTKINHTLIIAIRIIKLIIMLLSNKLVKISNFKIIAMNTPMLLFNRKSLIII